MIKTSDNPGQSPATERRDFLYYATASTGAVAAGAAVWPLINSMNPSADVTASGTVRVDLSGVDPVFVWRRSPAAIEAARAVDLNQLPDPVDEAGENPNASGEEQALDENRAAGEDGEWLIVIGVCTHLGCIPLGQDGSAVGEFGGWFCPCHGSHYDTSGRIRKGPAPRNLDIPPYNLGDDLQLVIGT
jgi:ubiquinol-cytochrome c reductase iron-sulfur subunit